MPSTTRGSILISTANDIGSTLVDKLGGDGYTPDEWDSAANLCGIASADIATALSNIQESTPGGADRGSISIAKANSIGRILNKKFDTSRGFKPSEWASAIDKLTPLEVKSASGAIASFADGADGVPAKSCSVSFLPSGGGGTPSAPVAITGVSGVSVTRTGKNLLDMTVYDGGSYNPAVGTTITLSVSASQFTKTGNAYTIDTTTSWRTFTVRMPIKSGVTYYRKFTMSASGTNLGSSEYYLDADNKVIGSVSNNTDNPHTKIGTLSVPSGAVWFVITFTNRGTSTNTLTITEPQIEVGSTATTYSAYVTPSVVTDTFGQTIYGGTRDLCTDKASVTYEVFTLDGSDDENYSGSGTRIVFTSLQNVIEQNTANNTLIAGDVCSHFPQKTNDQTYSNQTGFSISASEQYTYIYFCDGTGSMTVSDFKTWLQNNPITLALKVKTPTELTGLTPHEIDTLLGDNNIYADTGNTEVEYRADIDLAINA